MFCIFFNVYILASRYTYVLFPPFLTKSRTSPVIFLLFLFHLEEHPGDLSILTEKSLNHSFFITMYYSPAGMWHTLLHQICSDGHLCCFWSFIKNKAAMNNLVTILLLHMWADVCMWYIPRGKIVRQRINGFVILINIAKFPYIPVLYSH